MIPEQLLTSYCEVVLGLLLQLTGSQGRKGEYRNEDKGPRTQGSKSTVTATSPFFVCLTDGVLNQEDGIAHIQKRRIRFTIFHFFGVARRLAALVFLNLEM